MVPLSISRVGFNACQRYQIYFEVPKFRFFFEITRFGNGPFYSKMAIYDET